MKKIRKKDFVIIVIIIIAFIMNFSLIFNDSVWQDEAFTMNILRKGFPEIVKSTAEDVHPPLYYFIAKIFTICFGYSVPVVKMVSIVPLILSMIFIWRKSKKLFSDKYSNITVLFCLLIGFNPVAFTLNIELRMYTWAMFFVTCSGVYAYELYMNPENKRKLTLFIVMSICAAYTHYYAILAEVFIYVFLIVNLIIKYKAMKQIIIILCSTFALYLPWLPVLIYQFVMVKRYWWLEIFNVETVLGILKYPFNGTYENYFLIVFAVIAIGMITYLIKNKTDKEAWFGTFCVMVFILLVTTGCTISFIIRPLFVARYMYVAIGLLYLGIGILITKIEYGKLLRNVLISIIVLNSIFAYHETYNKEYVTGTEEFKRFAKNIDVTEKITTESNDIYHTLPYYLPNNELKWKRITKDTKGYIFTDKTLDEIKKIIPSLTIEELFSGDIDGTMKFNVYYIK